MSDSTDDEMAQQPVDIQALINAMTAMTTQLGQHTTQQNNNTVALQGALQAAVDASNAVVNALGVGGGGGGHAGGGGGGRQGVARPSNSP